MGRVRKVAPGIGARIESLVPEGQTMAEFAADLGVSQRTFGSYVRGENEPSFEFLVRVRRLTGVDMNWLLTGEEVADRPRATASHRLDPVILSRVSRMATVAHKEAGIRLAPEALVREVGAIYNEMLERVADPSDTAELMALLPWAEARLRKRLAEAVSRPGTGKRSA